MILKEYDIRLDIKRSQKQDYIEVVQGDYETNIFNIQITDNLEPYNLTGLSVEIAFAKPDNTTVLQDEDNGVTIEDAEQGKIKVVLKTNTIAAAGKVYAEVRIKDGDMILTTARFDFFVRRAIFGDDTIKSKDEWPLYEQLLEAAENENERIDNENTRIQNETQRENQEIIRQQNEQDRTTAESARNVAESDRQTNEQSRINNESIRQQQESDRMVNEQERINAEEQRISAESERLSAENERISREQERIENENTRVANEAERQLAEQERINAENMRISNETTRQSNEQARINAELERQTNEQLRREQEDYRQASIADIENRWNQLTTAQQQDAEVIDARTSTIKEKTFPTLNARLEEIEQDVNKPVYSDTITIEGGIGSIPSNAEGQISGVELKGLTATNLVKNGDFRNGISQWNNIDATMSVSDNTLIVKGNGNSNFPRVTQGVNLYEGRKYYVSVKVKVTNNVCKTISVYFGGGGDVHLPQLKNPVENQIYNISGILEIEKGATNIPSGLFVRHTYEDAETANGSTMEVRDVIVIDLTAHGLEDKTVKELDAMFPHYFDGTKSTLSAFRIRSVSEDESQESVVYVLAKDDEGNIEELRSLPNGTKDEVRVNEGKVIKRVSDEVVIDGSLNWSAFLVAGENQDSYRMALSSNSAKAIFPNAYLGEIAEGYMVGRNDVHSFISGNFTTASGKPYKIGFNETGDFFITIDKAYLDTNYEGTWTGFKNYLNAHPITLNYQLAEPITYPVNIEGEVIAYPNGTVYIEPYIADMFEYNDGITFDYPVEIDKIKGIVDGKWVELDNEYTLSEDGLTLTIEGVENGQQIKVYAPIQEGESTIGALDITVPCNLKAQVRGNMKMAQLAHDKIVDLNDFTVAMLLNHEIRLTTLETMQGGN